MLGLNFCSHITSNIRVTFAVGGWNRRSVEGYYLADDESSLRGGPQKFGHSMLARSRGGRMQAQLKALKEERNMKLLTRLLVILITL